MANLSLREVAQSQLDQAPVIDGQLIVCTDTGSTYRDIGTRRIKISKDLEIVSSLLCLIRFTTCVQIACMFIVAMTGFF